MHIFASVDIKGNASDVMHKKWSSNHRLCYHEPFQSCRHPNTCDTPLVGYHHCMHVASVMSPPIVACAPSLHPVDFPLKVRWKRAFVRLGCRQNLPSIMHRKCWKSFQVNPSVWQCFPPGALVVDLRYFLTVIARALEAGSV